MNCVANSAAIAALARKNKGIGFHQLYTLFQDILYVFDIFFMLADMSQTIREGKGPKPAAPDAPPKTSAASRSIFSVRNKHMYLQRPSKRFHLKLL